MMEPVCGGKIETRIVRQVQQAGRGSSANSAAKHFTRGGKLDYPNSDTAKASKRFVKGMKKLDVSFRLSPLTSLDFPFSPCNID